LSKKFKANSSGDNLFNIRFLLFIYKQKNTIAIKPKYPNFVEI